MNEHEGASELAKQAEVDCIQRDQGLGQYRSVRSLPPIRRKSHVTLPRITLWGCCNCAFVWLGTGMGFETASVVFAAILVNLSLWSVSRI